MEELRIVDYDESYSEKLTEYLKCVHPYYKIDYIRYSVSKADGIFVSKLVVDKNELIVGCHLWFDAFVKIGGKIISTAWGHDTYLDENVRKSIGLDFVMAISNDKTMGLGLTETNRKIQKKLKACFLRTVYNTYTVGIISPLIFLFGFFHKRNIFNAHMVKSHGFMFVCTKSARNISIINDGYWYEDSIEMDLYRGVDFLEERFFNNSIHKYYVFIETRKSVPCYFVVRPVIYRNIRSLMIVDFRYKKSSQDILKGMMGAIKKLAYKNGLGLIISTMGDSNAIKEMKGVLTLKKKADFCLSRKLQKNPDAIISVTPADSDNDFLS